MSIATLSPNGTATGYVYRRRLERVSYPETPEAYAEAGFNPDLWESAAVGFSARVVASITGLEERTEIQLRSAFFSNATDESQADYYKELAWRIPEWNFATEGSDDTIVAVPAPGEDPDNWESLFLLPYGLLMWLMERVRTIHLPKRRPWALPPIASTTATSTPTAISPDLTPPSS